MTEKPIAQEIADNLGMETDDVFSVIDEFLLQLHRRHYEYVGINGDYIGEELFGQMGKQGFYHMLGFLDNYCDANGEKRELLAYLGNRADWLPYRHQTEGWISAARRRKVGSE